MTAVTVGSTTDYNSAAPDNYAGLNNQEPSSPTLSSSDLWLVDPTPLGGETTYTFFPEFSVTNLSETVDQNLIVPFDNISSDEPEISFGTLTAIADDTFQSDTLTDDTISMAATTGNIQLASGSSSAAIDSTASQLTGSSVDTSFGTTSTASSGSGGGGGLSGLTSGGSESGGSESSGETASGSPDGTVTSSSAESGSDSSFSETTSSGGGSQTTTTGIASGTSTPDPTDVPFSFTESVGLGLLLCIVAAHKTYKNRVQPMRTA